MASNLIRHLPKSYRHPSLCIKSQQTRNSTSGNLPPSGPTQQVRSSQMPSPPQQPAIASSEKASSSNMKLVVGLSLGLSASLILKDGILDRVYPKPEPPKPEKVAPSIDPKLMEHVISQDRKVNQLENQLSSLRDELRERDLQQQQHNQANATIQTRSGNGNVFELSEVIQANNLASEARYTREMEDQRKVMVREHLLKVEGEVLKVENKYRPTINKIRELEAHLENQRQVQQKEAPARLLWISCQSLINRLRDEPQKPLEKDPAYGVLKQFAANNNELAAHILDSIPPKVLKEGVHSEESLSERFQSLEKVARRVAMVDAHGAGLSKYLISYLQSLFIIDKVQPISDEEIHGRQLIDPASWTTFDILARVRYCLGRRNLEQAVRYANQLKGQARVVARDWIRDARLHLETRQALSTLMTHAEAIAFEIYFQPDLNNKMAT